MINILLLGMCDIAYQIIYLKKYLDHSKYKLFYYGTNGTLIEPQLFDIDYSIIYDYILVLDLCNLNKDIFKKINK